MTFEKLPSELDLLRSEMSKKRGLASESEMANLEQKLAMLEEDAIRMSGLLDIDDEVAPEEHEGAMPDPKPKR